MLDDLGLGWVMLVAVALLVCMIFAFATPATVAEARTKENASLAYILGEEGAAKCAAFANHYFTKHFITTGIIPQVHAMTIPTEENKAKATGLENFLTELFDNSERRIEGFWGMLYGAYKRFYAMVMMFPYAATALFVALVAGLVDRRIAIESKEVAKAVYFHGAKKVLSALLIAPLFVLFWPFAIKGFMWMAWFAMFPIAILVASRNVQEL